MGVLFDLPLPSMLFFIIAGMGLGYLFFYRDRSDDERRIRDLEHELSLVGDGSAANQNELMQLQQSLSDRNEDLEAARAESFDLRQRNGELKELLQTRDHDIERIQGEIDATAEELRTARAELDVVNQELAQAIKDKESAEDLNFRGQDAARQAGDELGRQSDLINQLSQEREDHRIEIEQLNNQLRRWESDLTQQSEDAKATITALQDELSDANKENQQLEIDRKAAEVELDARDSMIEALKNDLAKISDASEESGQRIEQLESTLENISELEQQVVVLQQQRDDASEQHTAAIQQIEKIEEQAAVLENQRDEVSEQYTAATQKIEQLESDLADKESNENQIAAIEQQRDEAAGKYTTAIAEIEQLQHQLASALDQAERTADQNERLADLVEEKERRIGDLIGELQSMEPIQEELDRIQAELQQHKTEFAAQQEQLSAQEDQAAVQEALLADQEEQLETQLAEIQELRQTIQETSGAAEKIAEYEKRFRESDLANQTLRETLTKQADELKFLDELQQRVQQLGSEKQAAAALLDDQAQIQKRLENTISEKTSTIAEQSRQIDELRQLEQQLERTKQAVTDVEEKLQHQVNANGELRNHNEKLVAELAQMRKDLQQIVQMEKQINVKNQTIRELQEQSELQTRAYAERHDELVGLRSRLEELESAEQKLDKSTKQLSQVIAERDNVIKSNSELESKLQKLSTQLSLHDN